jgi:hypothetical protein
MSDEQKEASRVLSIFMHSLLTYAAKLQTYNQAMKTAKAQYSEDKKAYDNRTTEQVDAANAAVAAAVSVRHCPPFFRLSLSFTHDS